MSESTQGERDAYFAGMEKGRQLRQSSIIHFLETRRLDWIRMTKEFVAEEDWDAVSWAGEKAAGLGYYIEQIEEYLNE